ncbi:YbjN domain-containing protein [Saccharopolyspora sp. ASAGF58]|uniref:YbjN domain-containing protein n=1 Tax=Saccharopolyspora sp. ASAGF58 TaxID=2719023 RepID=UPI00143FE83E|nr:YbjN domain-containing protein [Saccharopolyspora sp. ASAGF58]QIZ36147.1 YbjN domain-containing protein [Saccharopolyspora sp. ASAGF58]
MATWEDLIAFVRNEYRLVIGEVEDGEPEYQIIEDSGDEVRILVEYDDDRSQIVIVCRELLDGREDWVQVVSVIGRAEGVDLRKLLEELGQTSVVCGAVIIGEHVVLRHSLPLLNLDINEFTDPLNFVAETADHLEEVFFRNDDY